jgi:eukaryotic-like serine/threonine-protein kinase
VLVAVPPEDVRRRRRPVWPWLLALAILLLAGGGVAAYLLTRPAKQLVPSVVGEQFGTAQTQLQNDGFGVTELQEVSAKPAGIVIAQHPLAGAKAKQGSNIALTVSSGPGTTPVPSLVGETLAQARSSLEITGLRLGKQVRQSSTMFKSGQVIDTSPAAGTPLPVGTAVTVFVSSGPPLVQVPDVTGLTLPQAKATLEGQPGNFNVDTTQQVSSTATPGTVISQSPKGGNSAPSGSTVTVVLAKAPATVAVPNVVGKTKGAAEATLGSFGFPATVQRQDVSVKAQSGIVLSQTPGATTQAKKGTNVTIVVGHYVAPTPTTTTSTPSTTTTTTPSGATTTPKTK